MVKGWNIIEEPSFKRAVILLGGAEVCDEALAVLTYALHRNPIGFPPMPNVRGVYLAKTKIKIIGRTIIPSYRLWFRVSENDKTVFKLWVEISPPEDMGFWEEEDDSSF
jgi:hypothetical protein